MTGRGDLFRPSLATDPSAAAVEVEVIGVGGVVVGAEHDVEPVAGAIAHDAQEGGFGGRGRGFVSVAPVGQHADAATVLEHEAGDVEGVGGGVAAAAPALASV